MQITFEGLGDKTDRKANVTKHNSDSRGRVCGCSSYYSFYFSEDLKNFKIKIGRGEGSAETALKFLPAPIRKVWDGGGGP